MEILVNPLNKRITATAGSNLLEVLREHQVPVSYSCMSGRCGTCRCKVVDGQVPGPAAAEGRLAQNGTYVLACQSTVESDCVIEVPEPDEVVTHPARTLKGTITAFEPLCHDVRRLRIKTNKPLAFSPGQYVQLQLWPEAVRSYSMAGVPADDELEFHIRIVPDGRVTPQLDEKLRVGGSVKLNGPLGASYLRRKHDGPMLCIAGGTGLAPMLSVVRGALESGMSNDIQLFFGARSERDIYGEHYLAALARDFANFHYRIVLSHGGDNGRYLRGLVTEAACARFGRFDGWRVYLAGPPPMVDAATLMATRRGVPIEHIYADAFYPSGI